MTDRLLPVTEWHRLKGTSLEPALPHLKPERTSIAVVEDDGKIVACWMAVSVMHAEGVWIDPAYRSRISVARKLWRRMKAIVNGQGLDRVLTGADSPQIRALLDRQRATPLAYQEYVLCL